MMTILFSRISRTKRINYVLTIRSPFAFRRKRIANVCQCFLSLFTCFGHLRSRLTTSAVLRDNLLVTTVQSVYKVESVYILKEMHWLNQTFFCRYSMASCMALKCCSSLFRLPSGRTAKPWVVPG